jgi:predicted lipopolysaccharide heptosyltransferase III
MKNILVIKLRYIGDVLLATPVLRALREGFPDARLTMAVNRGTEEILKWNPDVNEVIPVDRGDSISHLRFLRDLRRRRFDCVIDLTDGDRSAILSWVTGSPVRVGMNEEHRLRGLLYTVVTERRAGVVHRIERDLESLRPLGIDPKSLMPVLRTSQRDDRDAAELLNSIEGGSGASHHAGPLVMLQPGARYWFKAWPMERFAELADRLAVRLECRVLIGGDSQEHGLAEAIRAQGRSVPTVVAGRTSLLQHAALLKHCALFVGNDNGPMHMAAALGIPVVALFGPSNPAEWGPRGESVEVIYKGLDCRRCFHPTCKRGEESCMKQISVEEVFAAAERMLGSRVEVRGSRIEGPTSEANIERRTSNG